MRGQAGVSAPPAGTSTGGGRSKLREQAALFIAFGVCALVIVAAWIVVNWEASR
jgi:hypothetical protein